MSKLSRAECQSSAGIVGQSPDILRLRAEIRRVAPYASNVLITGPSGTGKELVARQIHALSPRAQQPFIPVDCALMSGELMSSQLFGHVTGAFTGANCDVLGCFRAANHGTLFLDEIGELEHALQAKLLRVLQERVVTPVGTYQGERVDVRVVTATNRDLRSAILESRFREDLYYRSGRRAFEDDGAARSAKMISPCWLRSFSPSLPTKDFLDTHFRRRLATYL